MCSQTVQLILLKDCNTSKSGPKYYLKISALPLGCTAYIWCTDNTVFRPTASHYQSLTLNTGNVHMNEKIEARSRNHFCRGKAIIVTLS